MAVELIFVILIMLVVAVIVIKLFTQQASKIGTISNTEIQQAVSTCTSACSNPIDYCSQYVSIGNGYTENSPGYYLCENSVPCTIVNQLYGNSNNGQSCSYQGYSITPLDCMYIECQYYINTLDYNANQATKYVFGQYASSTEINVSNGNVELYISQPSTILYPGPSTCNGNIPTWITNQVFGALINVVNYYNQNYCAGNLSIIVQNGEIYVNGICPSININQDQTPLCQALLDFQYNELNSV